MHTQFYTKASSLKMIEHGVMKQTFGMANQMERFLRINQMIVNDLSMRNNDALIPWFIMSLIGEATQHPLLSDDVFDEISLVLWDNRTSFYGDQYPEFKYVRMGLLDGGKRSLEHVKFDEIPKAWYDLFASRYYIAEYLCRDVLPNSLIREQFHTSEIYKQTMDFYNKLFTDAFKQLEFSLLG